MFFWWKTTAANGLVNWNVLFLLSFGKTALIGLRFDINNEIVGGFRVFIGFLSALGVFACKKEKKSNCCIEKSFFLI